MKIVILDNLTIGSDISLKPIMVYGSLIVYPLTKPSETVSRINDAEIVITNKVWIGENEICNAKKLKLICVSATGYNNIDIVAANKHKIPVANVKGYSTESVAQLVFTYILSFQSSIMEYNQAVKNGEWAKSPVFTMLDYPFYELQEKTIGIIGYGMIGKRVAEIAKVFGMNILIAKKNGTNYNDGIVRVDLNYLLKASDIVTVHVPLNDKTGNLIGKHELSLMKQTAIIINTARGGIVNENDLYEVLNENLIKGAALDVLTQEPAVDGSKLFELPNIIITPHIAWSSKESRLRLVDGIANNIKAFTEGKIDSVRIK